MDLLSFSASAHNLEFAGVLLVLATVLSLFDVFSSKRS